MTDKEITALKNAAEAEMNANEEAMLVAPLAIIGLVERLWSCERARMASGQYDELHDA